ncbi:hypothetical protein EAF00_004668 [Botryotinia globosa]|nr:hypothetical protein EAF00_004668 [Botryotinia globosa]
MKVLIEIQNIPPGKEVSRAEKKASASQNLLPVQDTVPRLTEAQETIHREQVPAIRVIPQIPKTHTKSLMMGQVRGGPKALSEGPASGSLNGRPPRSNTGASDRHSLSGRDLQNKYQPNRSPPSIHEQKEHTQISYGRNDKDNEPYAREIGKRDHKPSGSTHSKASIPTPPKSTISKASTPTPSEYEEAERTQVYCGRVTEEDNSSAYEIERDPSNMSALGSDKSGVRRASTRNSIARSDYTASEQASSSRGGGE